MKPRRGVRCPTVLQMEAVDCGAASLAMILAYHRRWVPLNELRDACGSSRDGTSFAGLIRAGGSHGLNARVLQVDPRGLAAMPVPAIAFWKFNHLLVVEQVTDRWVRINDPNHGVRQLSRDEFEAGFTTLVLHFVPGPDFRPHGKPPRLWPALRRYGTGAEGPLLYIVIASLLLGSTGIALLAFFKIFVDEILVAGNPQGAGWLVAAMVVTVAVRLGLGWLQRHHLTRLKTRVIENATLRLVRHLFRQPLAFFLHREPADLAGRIASLETVSQAISVRLTGIIANGIAALIYGAAIILYNPALATAGLGMSLLTLVAMRAFYTPQVEAARRVEARRVSAATASLGGMQIIDDLRAMGRETQFWRRLLGLHANLQDERHRLRVSSAMVNIIPGLLMGMTMVATLWLGTSLILAGEMTIGELVAFQALLVMVQQPFNALLVEAQTLYELRAIFERIEDIMAYKALPAPGRRAKACPTAEQRGKLEFRDVTFGYNRFDPPTIANVSFVVPPGQQFSLVGSTGSGKSTIARLLAGLYRPWSGVILFDEVPIDAIPRHDLARRMGFVEQQGLLFDGTIRDNLTFWDNSVREDAIVRAAKDALAHDFICSRPGGYLTRVKEGGVSFSGGEVQRLELTRALVRGPDLVVLDEGTSALDTATENDVLAALKSRGMTRILVTHRLSAIRDGDAIALLHNGVIVESGRHEELIQLNGCYSQLVLADL